jgi:6-pyruvoyltetrahydropterin/6-carboxytetrahydropterin synthase
MEIRIDGWQKAIRFSSAHLTADLGKCERLHGHTYAIHCHVHGPQGEQDRIVVDFVEVTRTLKTIADELDHYILVPSDGGRYSVKRADGFLHLKFNDKTYAFPEGDCYQLPTPSTTAEDLCVFILKEFRKRAKLPKGITKVVIGVDEGYGQGAWATWTKEAKQ